LIVRVEVLRALRRADTAEVLLSRARALLDRINLRRPSDEILTRAAEITPRPLRTLDAIHLATALDLSPPPDFFVCYDLRLAEAARAHGLAVVAPGLDEVDEP
jgi:predicted nucleic acid-binding protein